MIRSSRQEEPLFYSSDELIGAQSTFYERLSRLNLDWDALAVELRWAFCENNGRPTDPVVYLKCFFVGYIEDIERDTDLAARICDSISIRRFLFGCLSQNPPDHSSLSRVRRTMAERCDFDLVLNATIELLRSHGLVGGDAVAMDTTLVPSRARRCFETESTEAPAVSNDQTELEHEQSQKAEPKKPKSKMVASSYDLEATVATKPNYRARPSYKIAVAADYKARAILAADAYPSSTGEPQASRLSLADLVRVTGQSPGYVVADAGMDDSAFHSFVEFFESTPVTALQNRTPTASGFGKELFFYDEDRNVYVCPAGKDLPNTTGPYALRQYYTANLAECNECPLKIACYGKRKSVKEIKRNVDEASKDRVVASRRDPKHRKLLARRKAIVEPIFADFKEEGGLATIWTKGLDCARMKAKIAAAGWNLKILVRALESGCKARTKPSHPKPTGGTSMRGLLRTLLVQIHVAWNDLTRILIRRHPLQPTNS